MKKALIALDIDGTITDEHHQIPQGVIDYLKQASDQGYVIALITGRFFPFAKAHLEIFPFPYYLATQNGAQLFEMPLEKNIASYFLSKDLIMAIDYLAQPFLEDFIVYSDQRLNYKTFYREGRFSKELLAHILKLESMAFHPFVKLGDFSELPASAVPCLKNFGSYEQIFPLHEQIKRLPVRQTLIQDPTSSLYCMNLVTHEEATKGKAAVHILNYLNVDIPIIGAGNDRNDTPLLESATIGICVGEGAPQELKQAATWIAPSSGLGLIEYLEKAKKALGF